MYIPMIVKLTVGAKVYAIHKKYVDEKLPGGVIKVCKVKTFKEHNGEVLPVLSEIGNAKVLLDTNTHYVYYDLDVALIYLKP